MNGSPVGIGGPTSPGDEPSASSPPNAQLTHMGIFVRDLPAMAAFYRRVLGMVVTDTGVLNGHDLVFLSRDPREHHQMVLVAGRGPDSTPVINQISFRVDDLAGLRRFHALLIAEEVDDMQPVTHGVAWSIYFRDPEGNRLELYTDSDWYVDQPMRIPVDLTEDEDAIRAKTFALLEHDPSRRPLADWAAEMRKRIEEAVRQ